MRGGWTQALDSPYLIQKQTNMWTNFLNKLKYNYNIILYISLIIVLLMFEWCFSDRALRTTSSVVHV
jgi:hypothetical protein